MQFYNVKRTVYFDDGKLVVKREQEIPDEFLDHIKDERFDTVNTPAGEMHRIASLPVGTVESWRNQGFDVYQESAHAIVDRLRREGLDSFITTSKRI